ncbi:MAG: hypothetical protein GF387_00095 [Candidatus Portnoybacteria bacterium]|nr:hypothetical protein [Candidatus Portnoybacteria bacterium]
MKVVIGNKVYSGEKEPIIVQLFDEDKENIKSMPDKDDLYCSYPESFDEKFIEKTMKKAAELVRK